MRPVYRNAAPEFYSPMNSRSRNVAYDYHVFGEALLRNIGEYCSYCEAALCGNAAVEHIVSKSTQPQMENSWVNFLLACVNCNSAKGSKVGTATELANYIFPCDCRVDPADASVDSYSAYTYSLENGHAVVNVDTARSPEIQARARNTLRLVGLDQPYADSGTASNRRIENRTLAWNTAHQLATLLSPVCGPNGILDSLAVSLLKQQIMGTALSLGFWSVWITLFRDMLTSQNVPERPRELLLDELFSRPLAGTNYGPSKPAIPDGYSGLPV
jgi:uncharacterized protein (TIGR02646 family)